MGGRGDGDKLAIERRAPLLRYQPPNGVSGTGVSGGFLSL